MKYKAVIFDLDGVICHTDRYHYLAWKQLADSIDVPFDEVVNERLRGVSRERSLEIVLEKSPRALCAEEKAGLAEQKNESYRALLMQMTPDDVSPEVKLTLKTLAERGIKLAIGSSSKNALLILKQIQLEQCFDVIINGNHIHESKPHPEVFLLAAQALSLKPEECLVVEDADAGIDAAVAGGFTAAGIGSAKFHPNTTYPIDQITDILEWI